MTNGPAIPVIVGIIVGIAMILVFSVFEVKATPVRGVGHISVVTIPYGSSVQNSASNFEPATIKVVIGINNTVQWKNQDNVPHTVVSDSNYFDPVSGNSSTLAENYKQGENYILPGQTFNFTFTQPGSHGYHSEPDPWMYGTVVASLP